MSRGRLLDVQNLPDRHVLKEGRSRCDGCRRRGSRAHSPDRRTEVLHRQPSRDGEACRIAWERSCRPRGFPLSKARRRPSRNFARNTLDRARTGKRKPLCRGVMKYFWSRDRPPPVTTQCRWGWSDKFCAQVCRIAVMPSVPPVLAALPDVLSVKCRGSRANVASVAVAARKSKS